MKTTGIVTSLNEKGVELLENTSNFVKTQVNKLNNLKNRFWGLFSQDSATPEIKIETTEVNAEPTQKKQTKPKLKKEPGLFGVEFVNFDDLPKPEQKSETEQEAKLEIVSEEKSELETVQAPKLQPEPVVFAKVFEPESEKEVKLEAQLESKLASKSVEPVQPLKTPHYNSLSFTLNYLKEEEKKKAASQAHQPKIVKFPSEYVYLKPKK